MRGAGRIAVAAACVLTLVQFSALALDATPDPIFGQQQRGQKLGPGLRVYPEFEVLGLYDTNFFFADKSNDEIDSFGTLIRPGISLEQDGNRAHVEGGVRGEVGRFDTGGDDNYVDGDIFARANYILTHKNRIRVDAERDYGHDPFGVRRTELNERPLTEVDRDLDKYTLDAFGAGYRLGAPRAFLNLDYNFRYVNKQYYTNRSVGTRFLEFGQYRHRVTLTHPYSARTNLVAVVTHQDLEFDDTPNGQIPRGFTETEYLAGVSWSATGKTTGRVLLGVVDHKPDDNRRNAFTEFDYDVALSWAVSAKTRLSASTGRTTKQSFLLQADFINTQEYTFAWDQRWSPRIASQLIFSEFDQSFEGFNRDDKFRRVSLTGSWLWTRAFALVGSVTYFDRSTDSTGRGFSKEVISLGFRYSP